MKAYKGFYKEEDGRMYCQPSSVTDTFYYEEGKTYTLPYGVMPKLCRQGFHACELPMDVFHYYNSSIGNVEFHEVELKGVSCERRGDSKIVGSKITIGRKLTEDEMVEISIKMMLADDEKYFMGDPCTVVIKDMKMNYITTEGKILSEIWFDWCNHFKNGFARVRIDDDANSQKYNIIDTEGKLLCKEWHDWIGRFKEGFAIVFRSDKYNYIDQQGKLLSEEWFDCAREFVEEFGVVVRSGKHNFIGKDGKLLSDTWFDDVQQFYDGTAEVKIDGEWKCINIEGK